MLADSQAFSSFSINDLKAARDFYGKILGLGIVEQKEGLSIQLAGENFAFAYAKPDHRPATFTILNFAVDDIDRAVADLKGRGVRFESYEGEMKTDETGVFRGAEKGQGPNIAWFKDPAGNILSVIEGE